FAQIRHLLELLPGALRSRLRPGISLHQADADKAALAGIVGQHRNQHGLEVMLARIRAGPERGQAKGPVALRRPVEIGLQDRRRFDIPVLVKAFAAWIEAEGGLDGTSRAAVDGRTASLAF